MDHGVLFMVIYGMVSHITSPQSHLDAPIALSLVVVPRDTTLSIRQSSTTHEGAEHVVAEQSSFR